LGAATTISGASFVFNVVVDPSDSHIYALDYGSGAAGQIFGFNLSSGAIGSAVSGTPIPTGTQPMGGIIIDPTGVLMAVDNSGGNTISVYTIGSGGTLTASSTTITAGTNPFYVTFYNAAQ
jgi:DNA-binding beta-propeller fold protein YncE